MDLQEMKRLWGDTEKKEGMNVEDVLAMQELAQKLADINLDVVLARKLEAATPMEKYVRALEEKKVVKRALIQQAKPKKQHWKTKLRKAREWQEEVGRPRRKAEKAVLLQTPEGWWEYITKQYHNNHVACTLTLVEWQEHIWPTLKGQLFVMYRYNKKEPVSLYNCYIKDTETKVVLFDGKEQEMRDKGYIL